MDRPSMAFEYDPDAWQDNMVDPGQPAEAGKYDLVGLYDRMGFGEPYRRNNLNDILAAVTPGCSVLDVGCCAGAYARPIDDTGATYHGVDITPRFIDGARRRHPDLPFTVADARQLPFEDQSFDIVFCAGVLQHLVEPEVVSKELWRVCRKTLLLEANTQHVKPPWLDVSEDPPFIDVWYNLHWLDATLMGLNGKCRSIRMTPRRRFGFYSTLWRIDRV